METYERLGATVVAVNPGTLKSHCKWDEAFGFRFPICVDKGKKVAAAYDVVSLLGVRRAVFVIDKQGKVAWAQAGLPATEDIVQALESLAVDGTDSQ